MRVTALATACQGNGSPDRGADEIVERTDGVPLFLEDYAPAFRNNDIDGAILPELTADDLIGLGITSIGHAMVADLTRLMAAPSQMLELEDQDA